MGRKTQIAILALVALLLLGVAVGYAYDSSEKDQIADGVSVGGVDVGGMDEAEAKQAVSRQLLAPLKHSLRVGYDGAPDLAALADTVARAVEGATGVQPEIQLVPTSEIVKLGPPHKIPRTAKS